MVIIFPMNKIVYVCQLLSLATPKYLPPISGSTHCGLNGVSDSEHKTNEYQSEQF
jgi:hypothetical protein